jgi:hypothetical protein
MPQLRHEEKGKSQSATEEKKNKRKAGNQTTGKYLSD